MKSYLIYMAVRLLEMERILKDTGSIYLHCDPTASHYLKALMDAIFGHTNFQNELVWGYEKPRSATKVWRRNHDIIFFYTKGRKWTFHPQRMPTLDGKFEMRKPFKRPDGTVWEPKEPGKQAGSWWYDIPSFATRMSAKERTGFKTQKPLKLLERIISASSNPGDFVFDPFCGCATTLIAAAKLQRRWIGIDLSEKAVELMEIRFEEDMGMHDRPIPRDAREEDEEGKRLVPDLPERTDLGKLPPPHTYRDELYGIQSGNCEGCRTHFSNKKNLEVDHIVAKSKGGTDARRNLQLLCSSCNRIKGDRGMEYLMTRLNMDRIN